MTKDVHKQNPAVDAAHNRSTIRVLWDFDVKLFQMAHCAELLAENERLECLNRGAQSCRFSLSLSLSLSLWVT